MFIETLTERTDVIGIACEGKLSESDVKRMHALLHERLAIAGKPGLVVDLTNFDGYTGPNTMREDFRMDVAHRNDFRRIAVICDETWAAWGAWLANALTRAEMRWFDRDKRNAAAEWARSP